MQYEEIVLITGISGAGKSTAIRCLEDIGFFCVDNLPMTFIPELLEKLLSVDKNIGKVGFGIDIREKDFLNSFASVVDFLNEKKYKFKILFLEAENDILVRRFTETRRKHPLSNEKDNLLIQNILTEKELLKDIRQKSDKIIDTSKLSTNDLKDTIKNFCLENNRDTNSVMINLISFGFKYGIPIDVDMLFDVRFLPNPFYIEDMKYLTGNDKVVQDFVMDSESAQIFVKKLEDMFDFLLPEYLKEGKSYLRIGIGCTGGKHRSVTLVNKLRQYFETKKISVGIFHRDITK
jgi:UPF0042 nucleotide-binding protein